MNSLTHYQELKTVALLSCDFSKSSLDDFDRIENSTQMLPYYTARFTCKAVFLDSILTLEIIWNEIRICSTRINSESKETRPQSSAS